MFTIGQQLYRLTSRDETTLYVDPFFRDSGQQQADAGQLSDTYDFLVPADRALYLHNVVVALEATLLSFWNFLSITVADGVGRVGTVDSRRSNSNLVGANSGDTGSVGQHAMITFDTRILLPPGVTKLQVNVGRSNSTNAALYFAKVAGYLIPPGGIGRNSYGIG